MEKIIYQGETFYYLNGRIYDGSFIEIPKIVSRPILNEYLKNVDYSGYGENELLKYIKELKIAELYSTCQTAVSFGLNKFTDSVDYYSTVFPIITSCYRALGQPQKAIDFWMENRSLFWCCLSTPLLTSLAAAYCDVGDYVSAKGCADRAYALQGGGKGYNTELSPVYGRIKKEGGDL